MKTVLSLLITSITICLSAVENKPKSEAKKAMPTVYETAIKIGKLAAGDSQNNHTTYIKKLLAQTALAIPPVPNGIDGKF